MEDREPERAPEDTPALFDRPPGEGPVVEPGKDSAPPSHPDARATLVVGHQFHRLDDAARLVDGTTLRVVAAQFGR